MLCTLLNIKHIGGRPSSAPKLTLDTELGMSHMHHELWKECCLCDGLQSRRGLCLQQVNVT